jgi:hypothetical protein
MDVRAEDAVRVIGSREVGACLRAELTDGALAGAED